MDEWAILWEENLPFLHFTVGFTAVIDKSADITHPVSVYNKLTVQCETVMVMISSVLKSHPTSELFYIYYLTSVLQNKLSCTEQ